MTNSGELSMMLRSTDMHKSTIGGFLTLLRSFGRSPRQHNNNNEGDRQRRCRARVWSSSGGAGPLASRPLRSLLGCAMRIIPGQNNIVRLRWTSKGVPRKRERVGEGEK
jgi:hypothetical protein